MKKSLLTIALCIAFIHIHAQQIDTTLLYGRWHMYSMVFQGKTLYRDSMDRNIKVAIPELKAMTSGRPFTSDDSLDIVEVINVLFKVYMTFDKEGHATSEIEAGGNKNEPAEPHILTGTYEWSGKNRISQTIGDKTVTFSILVLTATHLIIKGDGKDGDKNGELAFTRASLPVGRAK